MLEWQDIFWLKCLILDRRLHFFPITAILLSQYKSEQHHVMAVNVYLLFGQKSTNLTICFSFQLYLLYFLMDIRNIISFANKKNQLFNTI